MTACTIGSVLSGTLLWLERYEVREDGQVWIVNGCSRWTASRVTTPTS
jgi:hypothetical protein